MAIRTFTTLGDSPSVTCTSVLGTGQMGTTVYTGRVGSERCVAKVAAKYNDLHHEIGVYKRLLRHRPSPHFFTLLFSGKVSELSLIHI